MRPPQPISLQAHPGSDQLPTFNITFLGFIRYKTLTYFLKPCSYLLFLIKYTCLCQHYTYMSLFYSHKFRNPYETIGHNDKRQDKTGAKNKGTRRMVYRKKKIPEVLINIILQRTKYKWFCHTGQLKQKGIYVSHPSDLHTGHVDGRMNRWMDYTHMGTQPTPHSGDPIKLQVTLNHTMMI